MIIYRFPWFFFLLMAAFAQASGTGPDGERATCAQLAAGLGEAWRTASWRGGAVPNRIYNRVALERLVGDPDLAAAAEIWKALNETSKEGALMDETYQFLVGLADLRVKYRMPVGGEPGQRKPMLAYLRLVLGNSAKGMDCQEDLKILKALNGQFFHPDLGFDQDKDAVALREFLDEELMPRFAVLSMAAGWD